MSDELLKEVTKEEEQAAEKVVNTNRKVREKENINQAFINRIRETLEVGNTGYKREVVLPIPTELVGSDDKIKTFLTQIGKISREPKYNLDIKLETETVQEVPLLNVVFTPTEETRVDLIEEELNQ